MPFGMPWKMTASPVVTPPHPPRQHGHTVRDGELDVPVDSAALVEPALLKAVRGETVILVESDSNGSKITV
jgi:hypothetical protein